MIILVLERKVKDGVSQIHLYLKNCIQKIILQRFFSMMKVVNNIQSTIFKFIPFKIKKENCLL